MLDVNRLRVFRAVVASGSVHAAATHLGYTPSAVSQHIAALQRETGLTLFEKSGRGIASTPAGRILATESDDVMSDLARLSGVVENLRDGRTGNLAIGCFASAARTWIPQLAKALHDEFPDVLLELSLNELYDDPQRLRADIDIRTENPDERALSVTGYHRRVLHEESYRLVAHRDHPLVADASVPLSALSEHPWIDNDFHDNTCGRIITNACRAAGFTPRYIARSDDHHTAIAFVAAGIGITALPELALDDLPAHVCHRELTDPQPRRRIVALVRDGADGNPAARRALSMLERAGASLSSTSAQARP